MKRRKFLVHSVLLGLGLFFSPIITQAGSTIVIPLPKAEAHVRHGNFNLESINGLQLPNGVSNVRFQRFYKNGFIEGPDDLCIVSFDYQEETHIIQFKFYELCEKGFLECGSKKNSPNVFRLM